MSGKENNSSVKKKRRRNYFLCLKVNVYVSIMCVVTLEQSFPIFLRWLIAYLKNKVNQPSFWKICQQSLPPSPPPERETESAEIKPYCTMVESQYSESLKNKQLNIVDYTLCPCEEYWITPKYNDSCHEGTHLPSSMLLCCCGYKILIFKLVVGGCPFRP